MSLYTYVCICMCIVHVQRRKEPACVSAAGGLRRPRRTATMDAAYRTAVVHAAITLGPLHRKRNREDDAAQQDAVACAAAAAGDGAGRRCGVGSQQRDVLILVGHGVLFLVVVRGSLVIRISKRCCDSEHCRCLCGPSSYDAARPLLIDCSQFTATDVAAGSSTSS